MLKMLVWVQADVIQFEGERNTQGWKRIWRKMIETVICAVRSTQTYHACT